MKIEEITQLILQAVNAGVAKAVAESRAISPYISQAEAYRKYGRNNVDRWSAERLILPSIKPGAGFKKLFDRTQLESVAATSNRHTYLPVADR